MKESSSTPNQSLYRFTARTLTIICVLASTLASPRIEAADTVSLYRGSCQVDTGIILKVDEKSIYFLELNGHVAILPRYDVVGVAIYPIPLPPLAGIVIGKHNAVPMFEFKTFRDGKMVSLATGWPVGYNARHIQLLTKSGRDLLILRREIWGVDPVYPSLGKRPLDGNSMARYELIHPLAFRNCTPNVVGRGKRVRTVIPAVTYANPVSIKRYQDDLQEGYREVLSYEDRQRFYAVPMYYNNQTLMGTWFILNSRYTNIGSRQANFLPLVQDELSEGPFGFQRVVRSGLFPIHWTMNAEPSVQIFYGLKADYIRMEVFADPTRALIGDKYAWKKGQLSNVDDRIIENGGLQFAFDFGYASLGFAMTMGHLGIRGGDEFANMPFGNTRLELGLAYNFYQLKIYHTQGRTAEGDEISADMSFSKIVAKFPWGPKLNFSTQYALKTLENVHNERLYDYKSQTSTISTLIHYNLDHRWRIDVLPIVENQSARYTPVGNEENGDEIDTTHFALAGGATIAF